MNKTIIILVILVIFACTPAAQIELSKRNVFYAGSDGKVKTALLQSGYTLVDDFEKADVLVLNGGIPNVNALAARLQNGAGLVLILGAGISFRDVEVLVDYPVSGLFESENDVGLLVDEYFGKNDPFITEINWNDAPQIRERAAIFTAAPGKVFLRVDGYAEPVFGEIGQASDRKYFITPFLDEEHNLQLQEWKYFNYMIYHLVERAAGAKPVTYQDYADLSR